MKKFVAATIALSLITALCLNVSAADTASSAREDTATASSTTESTDTSRSDAKKDTTTASTSEDTTDSTDTALQDAEDAYRTAKQENRLADFEAELKEMVAAGQLTQDQADLLLEAAQNNTDRTGKHHGQRGDTTATSASTTDSKTADTSDSSDTKADANAESSTDSRSTSDSTVTTDSDDTALEEAWTAYRLAKRENELQDMVAAGQLTQEQADLLLDATEEKTTEHSHAEQQTEQQSDGSTGDSDSGDADTQSGSHTGMGHGHSGKN